jgi:hypothetical protein
VEIHSLQYINKSKQEEQHISWSTETAGTTEDSHVVSSVVAHAHCYASSLLQLSPKLDEQAARLYHMKKGSMQPTLSARNTMNFYVLIY